MYLLLFVLGAITTVTERKKIHCSPIKKILYAFTFPVFMISYVPVTMAALFNKSEWKPIEHTKSKTLEEITSEGSEQKNKSSNKDK
jgi:hypothetical protein